MPKLNEYSLELADQKLPLSFYDRSNVKQIARDLIGKILVSDFDGQFCCGRIVETEAYAGETDRASHAWNGRRTNRTAIMYGPPAKAYVYLCYGIHRLFNVVTNKAGLPHAVLVRALEPIAGIAHMLKRTGKPRADYTLTRGPGNLARALGIELAHTGTDLTGNELFLASDEWQPGRHKIRTTPRIGVDYAGADALLKYRYILENNPYVSGTKK